MSFIVAGGPIRQRAWIAARHVAALDTAGANAFLYVVGTSTDDTEMELVHGLASASGKPWHYKLRPDPPGTGWDRVEPRYSMPAIAAARNAWVEGVLERWPAASHLWSVDSDILPAPDCLELLLAADKPMLGAVVRNGAALNFMGSWGPRDEPWRDGAEPAVLEHSKPQPVAWVGGCVLYRREVFDAWGARYGPDQRAEEIALLRTLRQRGETAWVHPLARTEHWMAPARALVP